MTTTVEGLTNTLFDLPGTWHLINVKRHRDGTPRRYVASQTVVDKESTTVQYESAVDAKDLVVRVSRRRPPTVQ